jgi:hypothetical protein
MSQKRKSELKGKFIITKAGLQMGFEEYEIGCTADGVQVKTYTEISYHGKPAIQNCELLLDENLDTRKLCVTGETKFGKGIYTFEVDQSEAHIFVDQKSKTGTRKDVKVDRSIIWDTRCLVIPSCNSFFPFLYTSRKYGYDKKGKQYVACGIIPKVLFQMDYLGEEACELDNQRVLCQRSHIISSRGLKAVIWSNYEKMFLKFGLPEETFMVEPDNMHLN